MLVAGPAAAAFVDPFDRFDGVAPGDDFARGERTSTDLGDVTRETRGPRNRIGGTGGATVGRVTWTGDAIDYGATVISEAGSGERYSFEYGIEYPFAPTPSDPGYALLREGERLAFVFDDASVLDSPGTPTELSLSVQLRGPGVSPPTSELSIDLDDTFAAGRFTVGLTFADFEAAGVGVFDPADVGNMLVTIQSFAPADGAGGTHLLELDRIEVVPLPGALPLLASSVAGLALLARGRRRRHRPDAS
jgi:hypothetical protein